MTCFRAAKISSGLTMRTGLLINDFLELTIEFLKVTMTFSELSKAFSGLTMKHKKHEN